MQFAFSAEESAFQKAIEEIKREIAEAQKGAVKEAADLAVKEGRANIAAAGFSSRFQQGLTSRFYPNRDINPAALIYHRVWFAGVFEKGITIRGQPLLWLPLDPNLPPASRYGGRLVSVNIAGKPPLLFDAANRSLGPRYFGTPSATIRKRFDLKRIFAQAADHMREFYEDRIKG